MLFLNFFIGSSVVLSIAYLIYSISGKCEFIEYIYSSLKGNTHVTATQLDAVENKCLKIKNDTVGSVNNNLTKVIIGQPPKYTKQTDQKTKSISLNKIVSKQPLKVIKEEQISPHKNDIHVDIAVGISLNPQNIDLIKKIIKVDDRVSETKIDTNTKIETITKEVINKTINTEITTITSINTNGNTNTITEVKLPLDIKNEPSKNITPKEDIIEIEGETSDLKKKDCVDDWVLLDQ